MKKLTRKLFISVLVAVFAFVALGTSTYAWITISTTADVTAFEATVDAGKAGIELSETGADGTWASVLTLKEDFTAEDYLLDDLTTTNGTEFKNFVAEGNTMKEAAENATTGFIKYTIQMRRSSQSQGTTTVKVDGSKVVFTKGAYTGQFTYTPNGSDTPVTSTDSLYATNALRLSIVGNNATNNVVIYEQAKNNDNNTTEIDPTNGFAHKYAKDQGINLVGTAPIYETLKAGTTDVANDSGAIITLTDQTPVEITFYLWIEGWDNECHANILKQSFSVQFGFEIVG